MSAANEELPTVAELISDASRARGLGSSALAKAMGFKNPSSVSMIKSGAMKLPLDKVRIASDVLGIDPVLLTRCLMADKGSGREVARLLGKLAGQAGELNVSLSDNEVWLLARLRESAPGWDEHIHAHPQQAEAMIEAMVRAWEAGGSAAGAQGTDPAGA